jgi:hypothetical protein
MHMNNPNPAVGGAPAPKFYHSIPVIVIGLLFCFPVGLFFLWTNPAMTTKQKGMWTVGWLVLGILINVVMRMMAPSAPVMPSP